MKLKVCRVLLTVLSVLIVIGVALYGIVFSAKNSAHEESKAPMLFDTYFVPSNGELGGYLGRFDIVCLKEVEETEFAEDTVVGYVSTISIEQNEVYGNLSLGAIAHQNPDNPETVVMNINKKDNFSDVTIAKDKIVMKAEFSIKFLGPLLMLLLSDMAIYYFIAIPVNLMIVLWAVFLIVSHNKKQKALSTNNNETSDLAYISEDLAIRKKNLENNDNTNNLFEDISEDIKEDSTETDKDIKEDTPVFVHNIVDEKKEQYEEKQPEQSEEELLNKIVLDIKEKGLNFDFKHLSKDVKISKRQEKDGFIINTQKYTADVIIKIQKKD